MAQGSATDAGTRARRIRDSLTQRQEVQAVFLDEEANRLWIICAGRLGPADLEPDLSVALDAAGVPREKLDIRCVDGAVAQITRRVRLVDVERFEDDGGQVHVRVTLEWNGSTRTGEASGERAAAIELRTAATAALEALSKVIDEDLHLRLVGIKQFRAFDADLVAVSLYRSGEDPRHLVGTVLQSGPPARAAAAAVLSALNRLLGNYLIRLE